LGKIDILTILSLTTYEQMVLEQMIIHLQKS